MAGLIALLYFSTSLVSQTLPDSGHDTIRIGYYYDSFAVMLPQPKLFRVDTNLAGFHRYQSPVQGSPFIISQGNTGQTYKSVVWEIPRLQHAFDFNRSYESYRIIPSLLPYYKTNVPFTELYYCMGSRKEQVFNGNHYQQVRRGLGVGALFRITNAPGAYLRQKSANTSAAIQIRYNSANSRYGLASNYINNRFVQEENGGIADSVTFEQNREPDRRRIIVRLANASNRWSENNIYLRQYFLTHQKSVSDSASTSVYFVNGQFSHTLNMQSIAIVYDDAQPRAGFYHNIFSDSLRTIDSVWIGTISNRAEYHTMLFGSKSLEISATPHLTHLYTHYSLPSEVHRHNQFVTGVHFSMKTGNHLGLRLSYEQVLGNLNDGDKELITEISYKVDARKIIIKGTAILSKIGPGLFQKNYVSNHFLWNNAFPQQKFFTQALQLKSGSQELTLTHTRADGYLYADTSGYPAFHNKAFSVITLNASNIFSFNKLLVINKVVLQRASDKHIVHLPLICLHSSIAIEFDFFSGALKTLSGFDVRYNTAWEADAYMPALRAYHLQSNQTIGNYPYLDIFVNMRVKRARLYVMLQHANQGLLAYRYYDSPGYPAHDRLLRFGVSWMFFD